LASQNFFPYECAWMSVFSLVSNVAFLVLSFYHAHASNMVNNSVNARSSVPNWFSLLSSTWALQGLRGAKDEPNKLDALENNIFQLAEQAAESKDGGIDDIALRQAVKDMKIMVEQMQEEVRSQERMAQINLEKKHGEVKKCWGHYRNHKQVRDESYDFQRDDTYARLEECKVQEIQIYGMYSHCVAEKDRCSNTTACCAHLIQPNRYCINPGVGPSPLIFSSECEKSSRCNEHSVRNKLNFFRTKLKELDDAELACEDSRKGCQDSYQCTPKQMRWTIQHRYCNLNQTEFEDVFCHAAERMEREWDHFQNCFLHNRSQLLEMEKTAKIEQRRRKQEWRALTRILCFMKVLNRDVKNPEYHLRVCLTKESKGGWRLVLPSDSDKVMKHYVPKCNSSLWAPGTGSFQNKWYSPQHFPEHLMPKTLRTTSCVSQLPTNHCPSFGVEDGTSPASLLAKTSVRKVGLKRHFRFHS